MSHGKIREDKECLNCGHLVEERFCTHCGQENIETRQPFYYLFSHFIEDFTHYDGQFWKTLKYLLFRPGKLTKEYLTGKRQQYVVPVKLYIFVSFITFFVPGLLSNSESSEKESIKTHQEKQKIEEDKKKEVARFTDSIKSQFITKSKKETPQMSEQLKKASEESEDEDEKTVESVLNQSDDGRMVVMGAKNMKQYDSLAKKNGSSAYTYLRPLAQKIYYSQEQGLSKDDIFARLGETFIHSFPKALFLYLPLFAFFLWIFHNKKKWWYFDHGIFTLHYFSFLLLSTLLFILVKKLMNVLPDYTIFNIVFWLFYIAGFIYALLYFFIAHHRVYESKKRISILTGSILFIINFIGLLIMLAILMYISFLIMH